MAGHVGKLAYHPLMRAVTRGLRHRCGVREGDQLLVAVSGGADSVALLRSLAILAPRSRWRLSLTVAHIQHHQRGQCAEADAQFVAQLARELKIPFERRDVDHQPSAPTEQANAGKALPRNLEARLRVLRYEALHDIAAAARSAAVLTAHHADDQLETMLMNLLRGSSVAGLAAMPWRRPLHEPKPAPVAQPPAPAATTPAALTAPTDAARPPIQLLRPMLAATHAQAIDFLQQLNQPWREDHTNADPNRTRARLRRDVLPALRQLRPDAAAKATQMTDRIRELLHRGEDQPHHPDARRHR